MPAFIFYTIFLLYSQARKEHSSISFLDFLVMSLSRAEGFWAWLGSWPFFFNSKILFQLEKLKICIFCHSFFFLISLHFQKTCHTTFSFLCSEYYFFFLKDWFSGSEVCKSKTEKKFGLKEQYIKKNRQLVFSSKIEMPQLSSARNHYS